MSPIHRSTWLPHDRLVIVSEALMGRTGLLLVTDKLAKQKYQAAAQWIDFEVRQQGMELP